jgi:hypothetical protein
LQFLQIFEKLCFEPKKKVDEKSSTFHSLNQYASIWAFRNYVKFEKNTIKYISGQKIDRVIIFFLRCSSQKNESHLGFFKFCRKTLWHVKNQWSKFWRCQIFCFRVKFFWSWPDFWSKSVQKLIPNGHNYPFSEPKCKYLGILERSFYLELKKFDLKSFGTKNWRDYQLINYFFLQCLSPKVSKNLIFQILQDNALKF